jgi:3-oxoacyl-[acyl-carrier-protein] synthase II
VLEEYASALKRRAGIYGEVLGYGNTTDARHMTVPDSDSQARAMRAALNFAGIRAKDVGYVNAHATATPKGDTTEAESIGEVFGMEAPVSATKSMTGHMLGASGAFEAAVTLMSVQEGVITPTANLEKFDCALNHVTEKQEAELKYAVSNSFGFGGVNAVLVLGPPPP